MPTPRKNESEDDFIGRCIPFVINDGTAKDEKQAYAYCKSLWDTEKKDRFILELEHDFLLPIRRQNEPIWYWDELAKRYRNKGTFLSRADALELALESILQSQNSIATIANLWSGGIIDSTVWNLSFKQVIKDEYIRQYLAGIGGRGRMTQADWGRIGNMLKNQYGFVDNFTDQLATMSDAQIEFRMRLYINSAHQANERAHAILARQWGADMVDWEKDPAAENCDTCTRRDAEPPQSIGEKGGYYDTVLGIETFPGAGDSECLVSCRCHLKFINSITGESYEG